MLLLALPVRAQEIVDGADLTVYCRHHPAVGSDNVSAAVSLALCYGFLKGVGDARAMTAKEVATAPEFCPPDEALRVEQSRLVFVNWAEDNAESLDMPAAAAVIAAMKEAYPCDQ